jgi:putative methyltransferase
VRRLLEADERKRGGVSLKSLTLAPHITAKKATYAVTVETLKHLPVLLPLLERTQLVEQGRGLTQSVALVLAYEMLWGEGLRPTGLAERAVLARKVGGCSVKWAAGHAGLPVFAGWNTGATFSLLRRRLAGRLTSRWLGCPYLQADLAAALQQLLDDAGVQAAAELLPHPGPDKPHPRTARVNLLKLSVQEALDWLQQPPAEQRKWAAVVSAADSSSCKLDRGSPRPTCRTPLISISPRPPNSSVSLSACLQGQLAQVDDLLPDLLAFPPGTDLHDHPLVASGALVLQSKASCMPAHALRPQPGWAVVDACAAPGNKTTHLAALMGNTGSIHAFEVRVRLLGWALQTWAGLRKRGLQAF